MADRTCDYYQRAAEAAEHAEKARDVFLKAQWSSLAAQWRGMAEDNPLQAREKSPRYD